MSIDFLTSDVKFYTISHIHDETCYLNNEFLLGIITNTNIIKVVKIVNGEKSVEYVIDVYHLLPYNLQKNFHHISFDKLDLIYLQSTKDYYTLFLKLSLLNKQYVYQINMKEGTIVTFEPILKLYETSKIYLGYSDTNKITYTDNKTLKIPIRGLLYIDTNNPTDISNKYIRQIKVYTKDEEKQRLIEEGKIQHYTIYPIVDRWENQDLVIMRLPNKTTNQQFDFSVGLGVISLND